MTRGEVRQRNDLEAAHVALRVEQQFMYLWTLHLSSQRKGESSDKQDRVLLTLIGWQEPSDSFHRNVLTVLLFMFPVDCVFLSLIFPPF